MTPETLTLQEAAIEVRRKPLAPALIADSICEYGTCAADPAWEQDTPVGRAHFCGPHSDEMAMDALGVDS